MQVRIRFNTYGANSAFGSFAPGDELQCSAALAKHLVDDIGCATLCQPEPPQPAAPPVAGPAPRARKEK